MEEQSHRESPTAARCPDPQLCPGGPVVGIQPHNTHHASVTSDVGSMSTSALHTRARAQRLPSKCMSSLMPRTQKHTHCRTHKHTHAEAAAVRAASRALRPNKTSSRGMIFQLCSDRTRATTPRHIARLPRRLLREYRAPRKARRRSEAIDCRQVSLHALFEGLPRHRPGLSLRVRWPKPPISAPTHC